MREHDSFALLVFVTLFGLLILSGCATGSCRQVANAQTKAQTNLPEPAVPAATPQTTEKKVTGRKKTPNTSTPAPTTRGETVVVFKYDGSLQCGMGKAISVGDMELELTGIPVQAREKKPDGLMHIQVCGQPTGMVNAYTIPMVQFAEAERRGFRRWKFD